MRTEEYTARPMRTPASVLDDSERVSLCEVLDRVLNKGAVVVGHLTISVADVDLLYLGVEVVLASMQTVNESFKPRLTNAWPSA
jgi:hypothetical protein